MSVDAAGGDEAGDPPRPVRYEVVFDCRDRMVGNRLVDRIEGVVAPTWRIERGEEGPTWSVTIEFPSATVADRFFRSDFYRQFCTETRRSCRSSVLVVPLGTSATDG